MNARPLIVGVLVFLAGILGSTRATEPTAPGGVTVSLSISGFSFGAVRATASSSSPRNVRASTATPPGFTASVALWNRTSGNLEFDFPSAVSAQKHFVFRILDPSNNVIWQSSPPAPAEGSPVVFHNSLPRHSAWKLTQSIPLVIDGTPLPAGMYTLEGSVDGTPVFSSTTAFQVAGSPISGSGVKGTVFAGPVSPVSRPGEPNETPVANAIVRYFNAIAANAVVTTVSADAQGHFAFAVPPGQYVVSAAIPGDENTAFGHGSQTVTVTADHMTEITFHLDTGIR